ncbi:MAG: alpha/beta fold hydrolase [Vicinamibacterales bacterium]
MEQGTRRIDVPGTALSVDIRGSGRPLLLLHGFTGCGRDFDLFGCALTAGYRAIVPDLRGHGRSAPLATPFRHRDAAADILSLLDVLRIERVDAIGLSAGANVLLHAAIAAPGRIAAMVLASGTPVFPAQARAIMRAYRTDGLPREERDRLASAHVHGAAQIEALERSARAFADDSDDMTLDADALGRIRARTLLVQGDRDPLYPVELTLRMYRELRDAALWIRPLAGHLPVFGPAAGEFVAITRAFLDAA